MGGRDSINLVALLAVPELPSRGLGGEEKDGVCSGKVKGTEKIPPSFCLPFPVFQPLFSLSPTLISFSNVSAL